MPKIIQIKYRKIKGTIPAPAPQGIEEAFKLQNILMDPDFHPEREKKYTKTTQHNSFSKKK